MGPDICVPCGGGGVNIRVGAIILKDGRFLMVKNARAGYFYSVGGRIKFGETAEEAVVREVEEETGIRLAVDRLGFVQENYFYGDAPSTDRFGKVYYELAFYFYMKTPADFEPVCRSFTEDGVQESLEWVSPDEPRTVYPDFFRTALDPDERTVRHMVKDDRFDIGRRILVLGCPGSGKSRFAVRLAAVTGLPTTHLDRIWWKPDRTHVSREEFDRRLAALLQEDEWILDGDYSRTYEPRLRACDTAIFLDIDEEECLAGITARIGKERPDMPWTEQEIDPELVAEVRKYRTEKRPVLMELFRKYPPRRLIVLRSREEASAWLEGLARNARQV